MSDAIDLTALRDRVAATVPTRPRHAPTPDAPLCSCGCGRPQGRPTKHTRGKPSATLSDHCRKVRANPGKPRAADPGAVTRALCGDEDAPPQVAGQVAPQVGESVVRCLLRLTLAGRLDTATAQEILSAVDGECAA